MSDIANIKYLFLVLGAVLCLSGSYLIFTKKPIRASDSFMKAILFGFVGTALIRFSLKTKYNFLKPYEIKSIGFLFIFVGIFCIYSSVKLI